MKASFESHYDVGDRSNDVLRVNGNELRTRVVCEGGNLGFTQLARVEYELNGGKINTDFVDNSGGVDCSDHEVNIKILLNQVVISGAMTEVERNKLLAQMTDEVANLVLQDNYQQNRAISWLAASSKKHLALYTRYIEEQEQHGKIDRTLEFLPSNKELLQRKLEGLGLTKPETAILFAYSKIILDEEIRQSDLPEDSYLTQYIKDAFPPLLRKHYGNILLQHRLRLEIISTQLSNRVVSDMGIAFVFQMQNETGATVAMIVRAYAAAHAIFHLGEFYTDVKSLDYKVDVSIQYQITEEAVTLVRRAARWLLRHRGAYQDVAETINNFSQSVIYLFRRLPKYILGDDKMRLEARRDALLAVNVPPDIAMRVACAEPMYHSLNIVDVASYGKN